MQGDQSAGRPAGRLRALIVEDEPVIGLDLADMVVESGGEVVAIVATAQAAMLEAERYRPDVVMMDVTLAQGSDGIDAAGEIRRRFCTPIVFVTGSSDPRTRARLDAFGGADVVVKPVVPEMLQRAIRRATKPK